ncbi:LolA family protein [Anditalea andensis]|uniref:Cell envelope biogenesis protein LolA n=1 Tax=Anditalea andensis TaxID=1048983 RepID=A0A074KZT7_9BACT|nr:outer membrane lipoprotein carrier protein LolA [Anditalea andensis]KEO73720.1 cell envelope biogenesis protein LolA [Anditalea andensis]
MNLKKFIPLILCLGVIFSAHAQKDPKAKAILDAVSKKYQSLDGLKATFEYTFIHERDGINQTNTGEVAVKGDKYRLNLDDQEIYNNGKTSWTLIKSDSYKEVTISDVDTDFDELTPSNIYNLYKKGYNYRLLGDRTINSRSVQEVELTAEKKGSQIQRVKIMVDKSTNDLIGWEMHDNTGGLLQYKFKDVDSKVKLNDSYFAFDKTKHPGVEVIDLR